MGGNGGSATGGPIATSNAGGAPMQSTTVSSVDAGGSGGIAGNSVDSGGSGGSAGTSGNTSSSAGGVDAGGSGGSGGDAGGAAGSGPTSTTATTTTTSVTSSGGTAGSGSGGSGGTDSGPTCDDLVCENLGTCVEESSGPSCDCQPGYDGDNCEIDIDDCVSDPCVNDGDCLDRVNGYECDCPTGFSGDRCELTVTDCSDDPCLNGATCEDVDDTYECDCTEGFTGDNCGTNIDECEGVDCENGGACVDQIADFECECQPGYDGTYCETDVDDCASDPCENGGSCVDAVNSFDCSCVDDWGGDTCTLKLFEGVGVLTVSHTRSFAKAVSGNGLVVAAVSSDSDFYNSRAFRWLDGVRTELTANDYTYPRGINYAGNHIAGEFRDGDQTRPIDWYFGSSSSGSNSLLTVAGETGPAYAAFPNTNGSILAGNCPTQNNEYPRACVWLNADDEYNGVRLTPPDSYEESYITGMSEDGSVMVGYTYEPHTAFRWTEADGWVTLPLPALHDEGSARTITDDGTQIFGLSESELVRWVDDTPTATTLSVGFSPEAVSADGSVLVGQSQSEAAIWDAAHGVRSLSSVLASLGVNLSGWVLTAANDVSADGKVIVGDGTHDGNSSGWIARLP